LQIFTNMALTPENLNHLAQVARLALDDDERASMLAHLNDFLPILDAVCAADTEGVKPLVHPITMMEDLALRLADDVVSETNQREANQQSAPAVADGLYLVPRVIE